jgi:hypothetical protein
MEEGEADSIRNREDLGLAQEVFGVEVKSGNTIGSKLILGRTRTLPVLSNTLSESTCQFNRPTIRRPRDSPVRLQQVGYITTLRSNPNNLLFLKL